MITFRGLLLSIENNTSFSWKSSIFFLFMVTDSFEIKAILFPGNKYRSTYTHFIQFQGIYKHPTALMKKKDLVVDKVVIFNFLIRWYTELLF